MYMSKIKRVISLLLITSLLMSTGAVAAADKSDFSVENNDLLINAVSDSGVTVYDTVPVTRGDFSVKAAAKVTLSPAAYPSNIYCDITSGTVRMGQFLVATGDFVRKGDPVAEVTVEANPDKIIDLNFQIATLQETLDSYVDVNKALLKKYRNIIESPAESPSAKRTAQLLYDSLSVEYAAEYESRVARITTLKNQLSEAENLIGTITIKATSDGLITSTAYYHPGQVIERNWNTPPLVTITDNRTGQIIVESNSELLRYNMSVKILQNKKNFSTTGRVVTCNSTTLSPSLSSGETIIEPDCDFSSFDLSEDTTIQFESVSAQDVLLVKKTAVNKDNRGDYVFVLRDGNCCKQYIVSGGTNEKNCWVIQGLEEGDSVIIR